MQMENFTLMFRDTFLDHLKPGIKLDNWPVLRNAIVHLASLYPGDSRRRADEDINKHEQSTQCITKHASGFVRFNLSRSDRFHIYDASGNGCHVHGQDINRLNRGR